MANFFYNSANSAGLVYGLHDWLRRYFVFERATSALEEFVAAGMFIYFNSLQHKTGTVQQTVQWFLMGKPTFLSALLRDA